MDDAMKHTALSEKLNEHGFDICHSFHPQWYNDLVEKDGSNLALMPNDDTVCGAVLIGNTRHLWPHFMEWHRENAMMEHPVDTYCKEVIGKIAERHAQQHNLRQDIFWSSTYSVEKLVCMQRVAKVSGFAYFDPNTFLTVHPTYGTWTSYRAVVVFYHTTELPNRPIIPQSPPQIPNLLTPDEEEQAKLAMTRALGASDTSRLCEQLHGKGDDLDKVCHAWIAMRDCVHTGKEYRFGDQQLMYHYTKDHECLER